MHSSASCYCCQDKNVDHCNFCLAKCLRALKERNGKTSAEVVELRKRIHRLSGLVDAIAEVVGSQHDFEAVAYIKGMIANYRKDDSR